MQSNGASNDQSPYWIRDLLQSLIEQTWMKFVQTFLIKAGILRYMLYNIQLDNILIDILVIYRDM